MISYPKYVIKRTTNSQYYWVLKAVNAETLITSETLSSKQACLTGIGSSKANLSDNSFSRKVSIGSQPYFTQVAGNGETLATSEMYSSMQNRDNGIAAVKRDAPSAQIEDLT